MSEYNEDDEDLQNILIGQIFEECSERIENNYEWDILKEDDKIE